MSLRALKIFTAWSAVASSVGAAQRPTVIPARMEETWVTFPSPVRLDWTRLRLRASRRFDPAHPDGALLASYYDNIGESSSVPYLIRLPDTLRGGHYYILDDGRVREGHPDHLLGHYRAYRYSSNWTFGGEGDSLVAMAAPPGVGTHSAPLFVLWEREVDAFSIQAVPVSATPDRRRITVSLPGRQIEFDVATSRDGRPSLDLEEYSLDDASPPDSAWIIQSKGFPLLLLLRAEDDCAGPVLEVWEVAARPALLGTAFNSCED